MTNSSADQRAGNRAPGRGLGRGLRALIVDTSALPEETQTPPPASTNGIQFCALDAIQPNPHQPRTHFAEDALQELADSIRTHGIIQPLIVTQNPQSPGHYWLVAGERRWRAARLAALTEVPVLVREASPQQLVELALIENIQRAELNAIEEGTAYWTLVEEFGLTHAEVAERVGKSRSAVTNTVRLLQAPTSLQQAVIDQVISAGHARALLALKEPEPIEALLRHVIQHTLSVRQTEALVKRMLDNPTAPVAEEAPITPPPSVDLAHLGYLENRFRSALGTRVRLSRNADGSGRLVIHFYNNDDLDSIFQVITGGAEDV